MCVYRYHDNMSYSPTCSCPPTHDRGHLRNARRERCGATFRGDCFERVRTCIQKQFRKSFGKGFRTNNIYIYIYIYIHTNLYIYIFITLLHY